MLAPGVLLFLVLQQFKLLADNAAGVGGCDDVVDEAAAGSREGVREEVLVLLLFLQSFLW